jgi:hypothetical protein
MAKVPQLTAVSRFALPQLPATEPACFWDAIRLTHPDLSRDAVRGHENVAVQ